MKVEIDENGRMTVEPETPLESYALKQWCSGVDWNEAVRVVPNLFVCTGIP